MAGAHITITIEDAAVRNALARLAARAEDPRPALAEIGEVLLNSTRQRFATQTDPDGGAWAPNSALTIARYLGAKKGSYRKDGALSARGQRRAGGKRILTGAGTLGDTIAPRVGAREVQVGTGLVYAAVHQFGNPANRYYNTPRGAPAPIPARPYLGISDEDRDAILRVLERYLRP